MNRKFGFTLAEVLITLLIIGIVAALTIPSVISNYQQQEFKTGLKKAVSVLNEAIQVNIAQDGETPYDNSNLFTYLQRHMSILKSNDFSSEHKANRVFYTTDGMRFEFFGHNYPFTVNFHEGITNYSYRAKGQKYNCPDYAGGSCWWIDDISYSGYCGSYGLKNNPNATITSPCVLVVDVNGDKKPNPPITTISYHANGSVSGSYQAPYKYPAPTDKKLQDVFTIMITDEKAIPFGVVAQRAMYSK